MHVPEENISSCYLHVPHKTFSSTGSSTVQHNRRTAHDYPTAQQLTLPLTSSDFDIGRARALVALGRHDHVVPGAELEIALALPLIEMLARVDGAADALLAADGPVLVKGGRADNGRLVDAPGLVDVVGAAVVIDGAEPPSAR